MSEPSSEPVDLPLRLRLIQSALAEVADGVVAVDAAGRQVFLNAAGQRLLGRSPDVELPLVEQVAAFGLRHPDGRPMLPSESPLGRALRGEVVPAGDLLVCSRPAQPPVGAAGAGGPTEPGPPGDVVLSFSASPVRDAAGAVVGAVCIFRDVTERRRAEEAQRAERLLVNQEITEQVRAEAERERLLREVAAKEATLQAEQRTAAERERLLRQVEELARVAQRRAAELQAVIDNMVEAVLVCDVAGQITLANGSAARLLGPAGVEGAAGIVATLPERLRLRHLDGTPVALADLPLVRALAGEVVAQESGIVRNQRSGADAQIRTTAAPIRAADGSIVAAVEVVRDVTELTELDRLKDQFIAVAAHELKTPVAVMKGYAQLLLRSAETLSPPQRRMLEAVNRGADRINVVISDLLDVSRLLSGRLEFVTGRVDLVELAHDTVDRLPLPAARQRVRIASAGPVVVRGDRDRLEVVLTNLIDNAVRYSPDGGEVAVGVSVVGGEAVVAVRDSGVGIPGSKQPRIFERFYRAHTGTPYDYGGLGVGLYISREIVARHGGRMWFESVEGQGSTFSLALPLA